MEGRERESEIIWTGGFFNSSRPRIYVYVYMRALVYRGERVRTLHTLGLLESIQATEGRPAFLPLGATSKAYIVSRLSLSACARTLYILSDRSRVKASLYYMGNMLREFSDDKSATSPSLPTARGVISRPFMRIRSAKNENRRQPKDQRVCVNDAPGIYYSAHLCKSRRTRKVSQAGASALSTFVILVSASFFCRSRGFGFPACLILSASMAFVCIGLYVCVFVGKVEASRRRGRSAGLVEGTRDISMTIGLFKDGAERAHVHLKSKYSEWQPARARVGSDDE